MNQAVKSLTKGEIQAFVNDGILSVGEIVRQNLDIKILIITS
ncbi:hypothetical protein [Okeania sp. SIO1I7]|nr:hypothetical protein [Okeania sp. SIO1I7]